MTDTTRGRDIRHSRNGEAAKVCGTETTKMVFRASVRECMEYRLAEW